MKSKRRTRRHKESHHEKSPFFSNHHLTTQSGSEFFQSNTPQAKLKVGQVNDPFERQADDTAHAVVNSADHAQSILSSNSIQRKEEAAQMMKVRRQDEEEVQTKLQRQEEEEAVQSKLQKQEEEEVQTKLQKQAEAEEEEIQAKLQKQEEEEVQAKSEVFRKEDATAPATTIESRINQARSGGQVLPEDIRVELETQFGASFKKVRIHDDSEAHEMCEELNALAFASGNHIFFKKGSFQPYTQDGKFLLVHELTHVLQQRNNSF